MPVYERQGGTNWVKIIVIVGIILLVLVGGCVVIGGIFFTRFAKQMMVSITQTTDAGGTAIFDSERFTLTVQPGWQRRPAPGRWRCCSTRPPARN